MTIFNDIIRYEKKKASRALNGSREPAKVKRTLKKYYESFDNNMRNVISENNIKIECKSGCSYCCYLKVDAQAHEVFLIADYIRENYDKKEIEKLIKRLEENKKLISPLTRDEHLISNIECALLVDSKCSVYSVRPSMCRKYHSVSVQLCKESFERPDDPTIPSSENSLLKDTTGSAIIGFREAIKKIKLDTRAYDINIALLYAFIEPEREAEWRKGVQAFPNIAFAKE